MRKTIAISVVSLSLTVMASPHAATITESLAAWQSGVGGTYTTTTDFGYSNGDFASSLNLADGQTLNFGLDTVYNTPGLFTLNGYVGQVVNTGFASETITFSSKVYALGFIVQPSAEAVSDITVTLSDGTTQTIDSVDFTAAGASQFIGYYGDGIDSINISFGDTQDIFNFNFGDIVDVVSTPEPMSMALLLSGVTGLGLIRRRRT